VISKLDIENRKRLFAESLMGERHDYFCLYFKSVMKLQIFPRCWEGEHFLHFKKSTQRTHPSVCCEKMYKSFVYQKNPCVSKSLNMPRKKIKENNKK
jgi:hypothetical protein